MSGSLFVTRRQCLAGAIAMAALPAEAAQRGSALEPVSNRLLTPERAAAIDHLLRQATATGMFNGVVKIDQAGRTVFDRAYGLADYERRVPFSASTILRIASLSKNMTNAALAALAARGKIRLDATVDRYLPHFPSGDRITLQLITEHRSGIPHTNDQPWGDGATRLSHDDVLSRLAATPLAFEPGSRRSYSNGGYAVLARIMEIAGGKPYRQLMRELVFTPLRMTRSGEILDSRQSPPGWAKGYLPGVSAEKRQLARFYAAETRQGGGSLYASADDVMRFFKAAWRERMEGASAFPALFGINQAHPAADGRAPGYYMDVYYAREADMIVSSTANNYAAEFRWAENLARIATAESPLFTALPAVTARMPLDSRWLGRFRYDNPNFSQDLEIRQSRSGELVLEDRTTGDSRAMLPMSNGRYIDPLYYWACRLDPAHEDRIQCMTLYESPFRVALMRKAG